MGMLLTRRLRDLVIILILVGTAIFFLVHLLPGNPAVAQLGSFATKAQIDALSHQLGYDRPLWTQYGIYVGHLFQGDLGRSIQFQQPVLSVIATHAVPTVILAVVTTVISLLIAVPAAVFSVARPRSIWSRVIMPVSIFGIAVPGFWLSLVLILVFGVTLDVLPISGYVPPTQDFGGFLERLILPVVVLVAGQAALFVRTLRESVLAELNALYLRTARAKGARDRVVLLAQALPNALLPLITVVGTSLGTLLGGIVIVENIFVIPGLGGTLLQAINSRDYPLVEGITLVIAIVYVVINLIVDLLYVVVDPRVRIS